MAEALLPKLKSKSTTSLVEGVRKIAGKVYKYAPNGARPLFWRARKVDGTSFERSDFNVSTKNRRAKNIYVGMSGWPEKSFSKSINAMAKVMKSKFKATVKKLHNGTINSLRKTLAKVRAYAKKHPDKPINLVLNWDTHGNNSNYNKKYGSGQAMTLNMNEAQLKKALKDYLDPEDTPNVGIHLIASACYSGGFLA